MGCPGAFAPLCHFPRKDSRHGLGEVKILVKTDCSPDIMWQTPAMWENAGKEKRQSPHKPYRYQPINIMVFTLRCIGQIKLPV
jgi:hypothetical protein